MANSPSARKRIRSNERKRDRNRTVRSAVRTNINGARRLLLGGAEVAETQAQVLKAVKSLDKAAEKGILHRSNADRRKARLMAMAHQLAVAAQEGADAHEAARNIAAGGQKGRSGRATATKGAATKATATKATATKATATKPTAARTKSAATPRTKRATPTP